MHFTKEEIAEKITQISHERHNHDTRYMQLRELIEQHQKYQVTDLRRQFTIRIEELNNIVSKNLAALDTLLHHCQQSNQPIQSVQARILSIKEYFLELAQKIKGERERGEERISHREIWEIRRSPEEHGVGLNTDEEQSLLSSYSSARETTELARSVQESLLNQGNSIDAARQKMSDIVKNINFSSNLVQLMRTRSREDNRLIGLLSLGLVVWGLICLFIIKPLVRGN